MSELVIAYHDGTPDNARKQLWQARLNPYLNSEFPSFQLVDLTSEAAAEAQAALVWSPPYGALAKLPHNRVTISLGQGVDHLLSDKSLPPRTPIVRLVDPNMSHALSHWVILNILDHYRDGPFYRQMRAARQFTQKEQQETDGLRVAVYGMGAIGSVIAERLASLGFSVSGWARTPRNHDDEIPIFSGDDGFNHLLATHACHVCILPLTPQTENLFNKSSFETMQKGAYFVNGGRGRQVNEADLLDAVHNGQLSGAALDVFATEPLPVDHPFWAEDKITIWPHVAAQTNPNTAAQQVSDAILKSLKGEPPLNQVNRQAGY